MIVHSKGLRACLIFVILWLQFNIGEAQTKAESGLLDAHAWDFEKDRLPLKGQWIFFKSKLLTPLECITNKGEYTIFPALWSTAEHDGIGFGTYYLKILVPHSIEAFSLEIPQLYNSYRLWVNTELIATAGKVGETKEESVPQWVYQTSSFLSSRDTLNVVLQIANFNHYKGGAKDVIYLGTPSRIGKNKLWAMGSNIAELILLFITGCVFFVLYLKRSGKKVILYFSLLCVTWSIRATFSNLYPITFFFPGFNWNLLVRIEYLTLYGAMIWSVLFLRNLFKNTANEIVMYLLVSVNIFFVLFTLLTPPLIFSRWVTVYLVVAAITVVYGATVVIHAVLREQVGASFLAASLLLGVIVFGYDIMAYGRVGYNLVFLHLGYMVMFMMTTLALLLHLGIIRGKMGYSDVLTYNEMFRDSKTGDKK